MAVKIVRSPRYPVISLSEAIDKAKAVYDADYRNKIPKELVAQHMGYSTLNGASLGVISAVTKYGLLEGGSASMGVSGRAVDIFAREESDPERLEAIRQAAFEPEIFREIATAFPGKASDAAIRSYLITKRQFLPGTTAKFLKSYRATLSFVEDQERNAADFALDREESEDIFGGSETMSLDGSKAASLAISTKSSVPNHSAAAGGILGAGERELITGILSKSSSFRLIVTGKVGERELEMLIKKLELDKVILAEDGNDVE